ncbi:propionyl-CoA carboxylase alpha chain [Amycolatopsis bartoniae]|uniref:Acetyl/propionyl-CoA carboxylase subuit alpha n=1 Tax=Amycolatopsis bartoniae TaxID=941986 RepID=A0A8H9INI4_9PSEU|nr:biotin carboxylase N-terminal domain-containing protein [Amycolatopsis bartoniae]MBB2939264.1 propionyl-CoA carboxylase alpha chain [Amycolatopsis bartoniae]TVT08722.1 ATP-grasp domain-containing protein [Amycolatopsis bartoniae]GHF37746.1 acetyl/propionyl-CoA carboxylase subuit alpha [Amycolatopsis bartoniae]
MITTILVANRGEIARRVFRTCTELGIGRAAVFSDPDAGSPHVREADAAVRLPGDAPSDTYLRADLLVEAAKATGADAVHPGYGFLSENAAFARAVLDAGLTWIGPPPAAIEAMGSKVEAKRIMADAGVPVLSELDPDAVTEADLPVLIKASAGGGGRGMRVVRELGELADAVRSAQAEAESAFGDPTVFCERYLETGRHIEVQVLADTAGTVWTVGERECSIQRRHQKVIEEAPSPLVGAEMRAALFDAARKAAQAIEYVGAGTVEFLATNDGQFFFLEMNTRLQVEHPVTELVAGLDLVAWQIRVAEGTPLPPEPPAPNGHAIEVRLYAEDPAADWQPQTGTLHHFAVPGDVRVDSGVADGSVIGVHYDPMLAKVIAWAPDRAGAARKLAGALAGAEIHGVRTNRDLLVNVLRHPEFLAGDIDTAFFTRHGLEALAKPLGDERLAAVAAAFADAAANRVGQRIPGGWRNVRSAPQRKRYTAGDTEYEVAYSDSRVEGEDITLVSATPDHVVLDVGGVHRNFAVARYPGLVCVGPVSLTPVPRFTEPGSALAAGSLVAPMPGTVLRIAVEAGATVSAGEPLLWLEAMKMEHRITAPSDGVVAELPVSVGQQVEVGAVLAVVKEPQ